MPDNSKKTLLPFPEVSGVLPGFSKVFAQLLQEKKARHKMPNQRIRIRKKIVLGVCLQKSPNHPESQCPGLVYHIALITGH